jgi:hypothetical protein
VNLDLDTGLPITANDLEWEVLHILLNIAVLELASNQSLNIENGSFWVTGELIFCGVSDEAFIVGECDPGWGNSVTLIVCEDFDCEKAKLAFCSQLRHCRDSSPLPFFMTPTQEYVVPKSIPMTGPDTALSFNGSWSSAFASVEKRRGAQRTRKR